MTARHGNFDLNYDFCPGNGLSINGEQHSAAEQSNWRLPII